VSEPPAIAVRTAMVDGELRAVVTVDDIGTADRAAVSALLDALEDERRAAGAAGVTLAATDELVRHGARRRGYRGPLRSSLHFDPRAGGAPPDLATAVAELVPEAEITRRRRGALGQLAQWATSGTGPVTELDVDPRGAMGRLRVTVPDGAEPVAEHVALVIDTARRVRERFPAAVRHVRAISFDHAHHALGRVGTAAGMAQREAGIIHLNASYCDAVLLEAWRRARAGRERRSPPADVGGPCTVLDGVTAHEMWHHMERWFEGRDYKASMAFRRQLGVHLGVETLEHAIRGGERGAPEEWRRANQRLAETVSPYAATAVPEATAEMFKLWWCTAGEPTPIIRLFGEWLDREFH
jgi:hypothetical protein